MTVDKIKNDAIDILDRQMEMLDTKIDREDLTLKKKELLKIISDKV